MTTLKTSRFTLIETEVQIALNTFATDVREGLLSTPKTLSCRHFYDQRGSELFEAICKLPEYYLTRAETEIMTDHSEDIAALFEEPVSLLELGSGSAVKTQLIIKALLARQPNLLFATIDISQSALEESALELLQAHKDLEFIGVAAPYEVGLAHLQREISEPLLASMARFLRRQFPPRRSHPLSAQNCQRAQRRGRSPVDRHGPAQRPPDTRTSLRRLKGHNRCLQSQPALPC